MTRAGFTGTQRGLSLPQAKALKSLMENLQLEEFHHGDCIGADAAAASFAHDLHLRIVIHPPVIATKRAFCKGDEERIARPYLERNHDIVNESDLLIATPGETEEQLRSGTWATIRFARKRHKPIFLVFPNGTIEKEGGR